MNGNSISNQIDHTSRDFSRGFLPLIDPLRHLPAPFVAWEAVANELSKLALTDWIRPTIDALPPFPVDELTDERMLERTMSMLSYMANLYIFAPGHPVATRLPQNLAVGWVAVAARLGRPPVLSYASQTLHNWRRIDPNGPIAVGNLTLFQNFLGGMDEEWFVTIHVQIEAESGRALSVLQPLQAALAQDDRPAIEHALAEIAATLQTIHDTLGRMTERCEPHIYYNRVRPFMFGWMKNPLLPDGLLYDGVEAFGGKPQEFRGETGAQSSIIYAIDAVLGIEHEFDEMRAYLMEMRDYMPVADRTFIGHLELGPSVRHYIQTRPSPAQSIIDGYNECIDRLQQFRQLHIEYAALYVLKPGQGTSQGEVGTGGTPFTIYLKKHIKETAAHRI